MLHFLRPFCLLLFIPFILLAWYIYQNQRKQHAWQQQCDPHLLKHLLIRDNHIQHRWPFWLACIATILSIIALSGPAWFAAPQAVYRSAYARVFVVDLSASMLANDIKPNRIDRVRYKLFDMLKKPFSGQTGMIAYSGEPYVVSPLTDDAHTISAMVNDLSPYIMPVGGHNLAWALRKAKQIIVDAGLVRGQIIVVSADSASTKALQYAAELAKQGIFTSVYSIGSQQGAPILTHDGFLTNGKGKVIIAKTDEKSLEKLAKVGKGVFTTFSNDNRDINLLLQSSSVAIHLASATKLKQQHTNLWLDEGHWFILFALPFILLLFKRNWFNEVSQ